MRSEHKRYIRKNIDKKSIKELAKELNLREKKIRKFLEKEKKEIKPTTKIRSPIDKRVIFISVALIIILGFAVYANSLNGEFLWDDEVLVETNLLIKSLSYLPQVFSTGIFQAYGVGKGSFYRPLQTLTYMIDYRFWRLSPIGYHLTNIILHIFCALLFYITVISLSADIRAASIAALLFVVHPLHTQAVTYISGRAEPLSVSLALVSFICFIRFLNAEKKAYRRIFYTASSLFFILALLSKEAVVIFPLFFLFFVFIFRLVAKGGRFNRGTGLSTLPFLFIIVIYAVLRFTVLNFFDETFLAKTPLYLRALTFSKNIFAYLGLLIFPAGLHMERDVVFVKSIYEPKVMLSLIALLIIVLWMRRIYRRDKVMFFFAGWFFLGLLPVSNIVPLNATLSEHWAYLPSMGIFAIVGIMCTRILDFSKEISFSSVLKRGLIFVIAGTIITYGWLTIRRNQDWRNMLTISLNTKEYVPDNYKVRNNLGRVYLRKHMLDEAIAEFEKCVHLQPLYAQAHSNLGWAYENKRLHEKALLEYNRALELNSSLEKTYANLANLYMKMGNKEKAFEIYQRGLINCHQGFYLRENFIGTNE